MCLKDIGLSAHNMLTILGSWFLIGVPLWPFINHKKVHFNSAQVIQIISNIYEENGYNLNLCFVTI